jgi:hypothetical protein
MAWGNERKLKILHQANQLRRRVESYTFVDDVDETPKLSSPIKRSAAKIPPVLSLHTQSIEHSVQEVDKDQVQSG